MVDSLAKGLKIVPDPSYLNMHGNRTFNLDGEMMLLIQQQIPALGFVSALLHPKSLCWCERSRSYLQT
jgi:hypothetical protein